MKNAPCTCLRVRPRRSQCSPWSKGASFTTVPTRPAMPVRNALQNLLCFVTVYFSNVAPGKFHNRNRPVAGGVRRQQYLYSSVLGLFERGIKVVHLVSSRLVPERVRQLAIGD